MHQVARKIPVVGSRKMVVFDDMEASEKIRVFTTRPDTLYGATYMVLAPEHPLVEKVEYLGNARYKLVHHDTEFLTIESEIEGAADLEEVEGEVVVDVRRAEGGLGHVARAQGALAEEHVGELEDGLGLGLVTSMRRTGPVRRIFPSVANTLHM